MFSGISTEHWHPFTLVSSSNPYSLRGCVFPLWHGIFFIWCVKVKLGGSLWGKMSKILFFFTGAKAARNLFGSHSIHVRRFSCLQWIFYDFLYVPLLGKSYFTSVSGSPLFQIFNILINLDLYICYHISDSFQWNHIFLNFQQALLFVLIGLWVILISMYTGNLFHTTINV